MVYLVSGPRKETCKNKRGEAYCCRECITLLWAASVGLKKKNILLTNSNCFTNQVSEAQAQTGLSKGQLLANTTIAALHVLLFCSVDTCPAPNGQKQKSIPQISTAVS